MFITNANNWKYFPLALFKICIFYSKFIFVLGKQEGLTYLMLIGHGLA